MSGQKRSQGIRPIMSEDPSGENVLWLEYSRHIQIAIISFRPADHSITLSHPHVHPPISSTHSSLSIYPAAHLSTYYLLIYQSTHLPTHTFIFSSTHILIHSSIYLYPSSSIHYIHPSIHPSIQSSNCLLTCYPYIHPSNQLTSLSCISSMCKALSKCWRGWLLGWSQTHLWYTCSFTIS